MQAASLQAQAASLEQQGAALQQQGDELQAQANALQQQGDQLKALQKKAKKQQKQADKLHSQLVTTLTKAGGDIRGTDPRLVKLQNALIKTKGDKLVSPPSISKKGNDVVYSVIATTAPSSQATVDLVRHLRSTVIPSNSEQGVQAFVGGSTAGNVDLAAEISSRLPLVIVTILILSMLVLLVAFRSVLIPLQAAATNFVTAMAAFGILTACFQWGWGIDIVGVSTDASSVPIASYVPLMMFAILFGLSMDYQVFLLSSVDHHRLHGEDDRTSVRLRAEDERAGDLGGGPDHDLGVLELHPERRSRGQAVRCRPVHGGAAGGDDGVDAGTRGAHPARPMGMVDARLAGQDRAHRRHRGHQPGWRQQSRRRPRRRRRNRPRAR